MENPTTNNSKRSSASNSPEFEFWNPSSQQTPLHSADQLFSGGILLPLRLLNTDDPPTTSEDISHGSDLKTTTSARWKDIIFKQKEKNKKKTKNNSSPNSTAGVGRELNINLWPFSRSRSAGNIIGRRPRTSVVGNRKGNSAPCSRSNSTGRKWPSSPSGVHLGRSSPVWQAKWSGQSRSLHDSLVRNKNRLVAGKVLNVNIPTCIGYRQRMSCKSDVTQSGSGVGKPPVSESGGGGGSKSMINFRSLFTKKLVF